MKKFSLVILTLLMALISVASPYPTPEYLKSAVVYQLVLRNFTREGNFEAATKMLEHVRSCGVDIVYLTPFVEADRDMDRSGWSIRQKRSGYDSPKNSYRISDYDKIDIEYGDDADFKAFNDKAHELGMKVYVDLVYLHCGPNNVLKDLYPDAFQRNQDGSVKTTHWNFPYVNFDSKDVRKYLIDSMLHWIDLGCDGFRCDVGDNVPIDFWVEAVTACKKVRPDLVMINEGTKEEWLEKAFDACYGWKWSDAIRTVIKRGLVDKGKNLLVEKMTSLRNYEAKIPQDALMFCFMENHDISNDDGENRIDRTHPVEVLNAAFVLTLLRRGLPLIYNGNEIADNAMSSFFAPVDHPARAFKTVSWERAVQPEGQDRLELIRKLTDLRHSDELFHDAPMEWVTNGEEKGIVAFTRTFKGRKAFVAANLTDKPATFSPEGVALKAKSKPMLSEGYQLSDGEISLEPWGYIVIEF